MIVAGLDEAGYGPLLGPLVVGCCAFELDDRPGDGDLPCIWKRLSRLVSKKRSASGRKIHINDSKLVYSPSGGLKELERSVLSILCSMGPEPSSIETLLGIAASHALPDLEDYPWYQTSVDEHFPLKQDGLSIRLFANALRQEMQITQTKCVYLSARVVLERQLNRLMIATRNKASALFSTGAIHLDHLLRAYGHRPMIIVCDRQGGREHYGGLLRLMFEEWSLEILEERDGFGDYRLSRAGNGVRIIFREKAEVGCLSVALASMLSKYLREALMSRFNAYWLGHMPGVAPTAGYYNDGARFLKDIDGKRREMGIADFDLIRCR
ncbi:MAG: hypothetical protein M3O30_04940 [Planctomycetota bacterium]|nr:hypothetical protein [Planctomycetota bacterium]